MKHLLQEHADINCQCRNGQTPIFYSLCLERSDDSILHLIRSGCDVNMGKGKPLLHLALTRATLDVAVELIKKGADINRFDKQGITAVHLAVKLGRLDAVNMLINHGADITISSKQDFSPLLTTLTLSTVDVCTDPFKNVVEMETLIHQFDPNWLPNIVFTTNSIAANIFEVFLSKIDYQVFLNYNYPFLLSYFKECQFSKDDWIKCLYLLLRPQTGFDLMRECKSQIEFYHNLIAAFDTRNLSLRCIVEILNLCSSLELEYQDNTLQIIINIYLTAKELKGKINFATFYLQKTNSCLFDFIIAIEEIGLHLLKRNCISTNNGMSLRYNLDANVIGYFSMLTELKRTSIKDCMMLFPFYYENYSRSITSIPHTPSLLELCRNYISKLIRELCKVENSKQYERIVEKLELPRNVKDIVLFKQPVYFLYF